MSNQRIGIDRELFRICAQQVITEDAFHCTAGFQGGKRAEFFINVADIAGLQKIGVDYVVSLNVTRLQGLPGLIFIIECDQALGIDPIRKLGDDPRLVNVAFNHLGFRAGGEAANCTRLITRVISTKEADAAQDQGRQ